MARRIDWEHVAGILAVEIVRRVPDPVSVAEHLDRIADRVRPEDADYRIAAAELIRIQAEIRTGVDREIAAPEPAAAHAA
jgi:hypothetical protein